MLKDELITKKEMEKDFEELFNEQWYTDGKYEIFDEIISALSSDNDYFVLLDFENLFKTNTHPHYAFKMLRSKLWNEGINLLTSIDGQLYAKNRKNEKYNDPCIINEYSELINREIYKAEITGDYYMLDRFLDSLKPVEKDKPKKAKRKPKTEKKLVVNNLVNNPNSTGFKQNEVYGIKITGYTTAENNSVHTIPNNYQDNVMNDFEKEE